VHLYALGLAQARGLNATVGLPEVYPVQVQGPKSKDVMTTLVGSPIEDVKYYWTLDAEIDGIPVVISRTGWTGEVGYEVYLTDPSRGADLWNAIMEAGRPHDIRPIAPCEARRIEAGIFNYNSDMTLANNPFEVMGLERLVEEQESDYVGKAALERIRAEGVSRKLVGIDVPGDALSFEISEFRPALHDGEAVGHVTDLIWSPRLEKNIGYVWVPIELAEPGNDLEILWPGGERTSGTTAEIPFLDPKKAIPAA
jgi:aminomethyltransferase